MKRSLALVAAILLTAACGKAQNTASAAASAPVAKADANTVDGNGLRLLDSIVQNDTCVSYYRSLIASSNNVQATFVDGDRYTSRTYDLTFTFDTLPPAIYSRTDIGAMKVILTDTRDQTIPDAPSKWSVQCLGVTAPPK